MGLFFRELELRCGVPVIFATSTDSKVHIELSEGVICLYFTLLEISSLIDAGI